MCACLVTMSVVQSDKVTPASFTYLRKYRVYSFFGWLFRWYEGSYATDFYGKVVMDLVKGVRYHIDATWVGADGRTRSSSIEFVVVACPLSRILSMPP